MKLPVKGPNTLDLLTLFSWRERTTTFSSNLLRFYFVSDVVIESARKLEIGTQILEHVHRATLLCLCSQVLCTHLPLNTFNLLMRGKIILYTHRGIACGITNNFWMGWYCLTVFWSDLALSMAWIMNCFQPGNLCCVLSFYLSMLSMPIYLYSWSVENTGWRLCWSQSSWHNDAWYFFPFSFAPRKQANIVWIKEKRQLSEICSKLCIHLWFDHLRTNQVFWEAVLYVFVLLVLVQ